MVKEEWAELYRDESRRKHATRVEDWVYEQNYQLIESLIRKLI
jgi:hypothetical protein